MKAIIFFIRIVIILTYTLVFFEPHAILAQGAGTTSVVIKDIRGNEGPIHVDCTYPLDADRCLKLEATYTDIREPDRYRVSSVAYAPVGGFDQGTLIDIAADDHWSNTLSLPFPFCFYGTTFNAIVVSDNGMVSFNTSNRRGNAPRSISDDLPSSLLPGNTIFGVFHDLTMFSDVHVDCSSPTSTCGKIRYNVVGTAPNRKYVINYDNLNHFACPDKRSTTQIVLYETTNIIEVHIKEKPSSCNAAVEKKALVGINNETGTLGVTVPGRGRGEWSATNESWRFEPDGRSTITVKWYNQSGDFLDSGNTITVCPGEDMRYRVDVTYNICRPFTISDTIDIIFDRSYPRADDIERSYCEASPLNKRVDLNPLISEAIQHNINIPSLTVTVHESLADARANIRPQPWVYTMTAAGTKTFYLRVERVASCYETSTITLTLREQPVFSNQELVLCDTGGTGRIDIDVNALKDELVGSSLVDMDVKFYQRLVEAQEPRNPYGSSAHLTLGTSGLTFYVRISNKLNPACFTIIELNVSLRPSLPLFPKTITICTDSFDAEKPVDLSAYIDAITGRRTSTTLTLGGVNLNTLTNYLVKDGDVLTVRGSDPGFCTGGTATITIKFCTSTLPNIEFPFSECSSDILGTATVNLNTYYTTITAGMAATLYGFYTTRVGAENQDPGLKITDPVRYVARAPITRVYVLFKDDVTGALVVREIKITVNIFVDPGGALVEEKICDYRNDGVETVDLSRYRSIFSGYYPGSSMTVTFHETEADAISNTRPITSIAVRNPPPTIVHVRVAFSARNTCFFLYTLQFELIPIILEPLITVRLCDSGNDRRESYDLNNLNYLSPAGTSIAFYNTLNDAYDAVRPIARAFPRLINDPIPTIYYRIEGTSICSTIGSVTFSFLETPLPNPLDDIHICGSDGLGTTRTVDLTPNIAVSGVDTRSISIDFYTDPVAAERGGSVSKITSPDRFITTRTVTGIYVRFTHTSTLCYEVRSFDVIIDDFPAGIEPEVLICDFENDNEETISLSTINSLLFSPSAGFSAGDFDIRYFPDPISARNNTGQISNHTVRTGTTLYVRLSKGSACFIVEQVRFRLRPSPGATNSVVTICDNHGDGREEIDLTTYRSSIISGISGYNFTFYNNRPDALIARNRIGIPTRHLLSGLDSSRDVTIFVRVEDGTSCFSIVEIVFRIHPEIPVQDIAIETCDRSDGAFRGQVDLPNHVDRMFTNSTYNALNSLTITYFRSEAGALSNDLTNRVVDEKFHDVTTQFSSVWVRFENDATGCHIVKEIKIEIVPSPKLINNATVLCNPTFDAGVGGGLTIDLSSLVAKTILAPPPTFAFSYFSSEENALSGEDAIPPGDLSNYVITSFPTTIFVRGLNRIGGCVDIRWVTINNFGEVPLLATEVDLYACDNDNDGYGSFDLTTVQGALTSYGMPVFTYYRTLEDAKADEHPIFDITNYTNGTAFLDEVYVRIEDRRRIDYIAAGNTSLPEDYHCPALGKIILKTFYKEYTIPPDLYYCDNNGDDEEYIDLDNYLASVLVGESGIDFIFYTSHGDATTGASPITSSGRYLLRSFPVKLFVRIIDRLSACYSIYELNIHSNPYPEVHDHEVRKCDFGLDIQEYFDLASYQGSMTGDPRLYRISYYTTALGAELMDSSVQITDLHYLATRLSTPIWVRFEFPGTGCYSVAKLTLTLIEGPEPDVSRPLTYCDDNNDGFGVFDLSLAMIQVAGGASHVTVDFYETQQNAINDRNRLGSGLYSNIVAHSQTLYLRITDDITGCYNLNNIRLVVYPSPKGTLPTRYVACEGATDGFAVFDLTTKEAEILGSLLPATNTVTFHRTQDDANRGMHPIVNKSNFTNTVVNNQIVFVRIEDTGTGCFDTITLELFVKPLPSVAYPVETYILCDYDDPRDHKELFDLESWKGKVTEETGNVITYHRNRGDADAGIDPLPFLYGNDSPALQTIFVRVESADTGCFVVTLLDLRVFPAPLPLAPLAPVVSCDDSGGGHGWFDLDALIPGIRNGATDIEVTFHDNEIDARRGIHELGSPYRNITRSNQTIYIRAINEITGCVTVVSMELEVKDGPIIPALGDFKLCDASGGHAFFNLDDRTRLILAGFVNPLDYSVRYYTTLDDAKMETNAIARTMDFRNLMNPQSIWVRVNDLRTGCPRIESFNLVVNTPLPIRNPSPIELCGVLGNTIFDLTSRNSEIWNGPAGYKIQYYLTLGDAEGDIHAIENPEAYRHLSLSSVSLIHVAVTDLITLCRSYVTLTLRIFSNPTPPASIAPLVVCDDGLSGDGTVIFNLRLREEEIRNRNAMLQVDYYESRPDAEQEVRKIFDPGAYVSESRQVFARVTSPGTQRCYTIVPLDLMINSQPLAGGFGGSIKDYALCSGSDFASFSLNSKSAEILNGQDASDYLVTYHSSYRDAENNANPLPSRYTNISNPQRIYVRVSDRRTLCSNFSTSFNLVVERTTVANAVSDLRLCDDGIEVINLRDQDLTILGIQDPLQYKVMYFESEDHANKGTHSIPNLENYRRQTSMEDQIIWARVSNVLGLSDCDAITNFKVLFDPLPNPPMNGVEYICMDQETGDVVGSVILNSGLSRDMYEFNWYFNDTLIRGAQESTYEAHAPGKYEIEVSSPGTGCSSKRVKGVVILKEMVLPTIRDIEINNTFSEKQTVTVVLSESGSYEYRLNEGVYQSSPKFENIPSGVHHVTVRSILGCREEVSKEFILMNYPHYFTPNGDGVNDTWNILDLKDQVTAKIYIFDKYGKLLKVISPSGSGWDGTFHGNSMPASDYWFVLNFEENGEMKEFRSHFTLKR